MGQSLERTGCKFSRVLSPWRHTEGASFLPTSNGGAHVKESTPLGTQGQGLLPGSGELAPSAQNTPKFQIPRRDTGTQYCSVCTNSEVSFKTHLKMMGTLPKSKFPGIRPKASLPAILFFFKDNSFKPVPAQESFGTGFCN